MIEANCSLSLHYMYSAGENSPQIPFQLFVEVNKDEGVTYWIQIDQKQSNVNKITINVLPCKIPNVLPSKLG